MSGRAPTRRTPSNTTTLPPDDEEILQQLMADDTILLVVGPLILIVIGIPGNILTMKVLSRQLNKDKIFRIYLNSMCSFNIISIVIFFARNITQALTGSELIIYSVTLCVIVRWITYTLTTITNWHLVVITGFRYFFLIPRTRKLTASLNPVIIIVVFSSFFCVLIIVILAGGLQFIDDDGDEIECRMNTVSSWFHFLVIVFAFLPALLLLFFNFGIYWMHAKAGSGLMDSEATTRVRSQLMFLTVLSSVQFILTVFPVAIYQLMMHYVYDYKSALQRAQASLGCHWTVLLLYTNYATNFVIYCFFGKKFRRELRKYFDPMMHRCCCYFVLNQFSSKQDLSDNTGSKAIESTMNETTVPQVAAAVSSSVYTRSFTYSTEV